MQGRADADVQDCDQVMQCPANMFDLMLILESSVGLKEEAVSKAIYGNILQMHSWSRENESLFAGTDVGVVLSKVMQAFVATTRASKSILVVG